MKLIFAIVFAAATMVHCDDSQLVHKFKSGNNRFATDVYKELLKEFSSKNFLFSPLSAEIILALTQFGAKGQTAQQLAHGLHLTEDKQELENTFKQLNPSLKGNNKYILSSANKIFIKEDYKIREDFKNVAQNSFGADIQNINFKNKQPAAEEMNSWVEEKTHHKIKNIIDPEELSEDSLIMLINALYFKGSWVKAFNKEHTHKRNFFINHNEHVDADMMDNTAYYRYYESPQLKAQFLEMPYEGKDISMVVVLPNDKEGLSALENQIDQVVNTDIKRMSKVHVQIPKFKRETLIKLTDILKSLGIKDAFEDYADFSGFGAPGEDRIKISSVVQKAFIEVNEEGTIAAAATAVHGIVAISAIIEEDPKQFIADHPFIFYMKSPVGVMFIGRYIK